jgi:hypothetical protein
MKKVLEYTSVLSKPLIMLLMKVISITKSALFKNAAELNDKWQAN